MAIRTGPTNPRLQDMIQHLYSVSAKHNVTIWKRVASDLERPTRIRREVTIRKLNAVCNNNETIIVPGKVLGNDELAKKLTVAAWQFSQGAMKSISKNGKAITILGLLQHNPKGNNVRIIG